MVAYRRQNLCRHYSTVRGTTELTMVDYVCLPYTVRHRVNKQEFYVSHLQVVPKGKLRIKNQKRHFCFCFWRPFWNDLSGYTFNFFQRGRGWNGSYFRKLASTSTVHSRYRDQFCSHLNECSTKTITLWSKLIITTQTRIKSELPRSKNNFLAEEPFSLKLSEHSYAIYLIRS